MTQIQILINIQFNNDVIFQMLKIIWRGVRSDARLSYTETRFQKCSQIGKNGSKFPMLSISMAHNVISCKKSKETLKN